MFDLTLFHGDREAPADADGSLCDCRGLWVTSEVMTGVSCYLLHVAKHVLPAVEDAFALLRIQVENEVSGVVLIALLIPARETRSLSLLHPCLLLS